MHTLDQLTQTINTRAGEKNNKSYTTSLLTQGREKCAQKFGEEAIETIIAATKGDRDEVISESADMLYHWLVLLKSCDISPNEVYEKLATRQNISGLEEKASRS